MAKNKRKIISNSWQYGEIGDRANGFRMSDIYNNSAREITNMIVTDLGTLKVAKEFKSTNLSINGNILKTAETSDNSYMLLTDTNLYLISKSDNSITKTVAHTIGNSANISLIGKEYVSIYSKYGSVPVKVYNIKDLTEKTIELKYPIKDKKVIELSLWRISKDPIDTSKLRCVQMLNAQNPKIKIKDRKIYLTQSDILINRIYLDYNISPQADYFNGAKDGDIYGILRATYETSKTDSYIIDNTNVSFGTLTTDDKYKGKYFTEMNGGNCDGIFSFGKLINITQPSIVSFYQDRAVFYVNNYLYFSKLREYFDFRNDIESDSPFFLQLNPINNTIGSVVGLVSSNGLYVLTTAGIYLIGYGSYTLTPQSISSSVLPITDMGVGNSYEVLDNILYFINYNGVLKAIVLDRTSQQLAFTVHTVDKYSSKNLFQDISKVSIEDKDYIMARSKDNKKMYLIEPIDYEGIFRKTSLEFEFTGNVLGLTDRFIMGNKVFNVGDKNYKISKIVCNPPALSGDSVLVDGSSSIESVTVKLINEDKLALEGVKILGYPVRNLRSEFNLYDIYRVNINKTVGNGFDIQIHSRQNDKVLEVQTVQSIINVVEDI